jgi:hypothetical protein
MKLEATSMLSPLRFSFVVSVRVYKCYLGSATRLGYIHLTTEASTMEVVLVESDLSL